MATSFRDLRTTAVGVAIILAGCGAPAGDRPLTSLDLDRVVLAADEAPSGMAHDETEAGPDAADSIMVTARAEEARQLDGFVDGRASFFSGDGFLLSWAAVFETVAQAEDAFDLYAAEFSDPEAYGLDSTPGSGPGDEGMCDQGLVPATGAEESICLWRLGNAVMIEIRAIAEEMIASARP